MAGENARTVINFDMCKCIESIDGSTSKLHKDKLESVINDVVLKWPAIKDFKNELSDHVAFTIEEGLCNLAGKKPELFDGIDGVYIEYPDKSVNISVYHGDDLLAIHKGAESGGRMVGVQYKNDNVIVIRSYRDIMRRETINYFLCINCSCDIKYGITVPTHMHIKTPLSLNNNMILSPIVVTEDNIIEVRGNVFVEADVPIIAQSVDEVIFKGRGTITLTCTDTMQPCIGCRTYTGMSYGRWERSQSNPPKRIVVDGVSVICKSKVDNFTLGKYGEEFVPEIVCKNNGKIVCPEVEGRRIVTKQATAPDGSTKVCEPMGYGIVKDGMKESDLINSEVKDRISKLPEKARDFVTCKTQPDNIEEALRLLEMNNTLDVSLVLSGTHSINNARICALMYDNSIYDGKEFVLEMKKVDSIVNRFVDKSAVSLVGCDIEPADLVQCLIIVLYDTLGVNMTDYDYEVLYEMIPSYYFDNWVHDDIKATVKTYIDENVGARKIIGRIRNSLKISECIEELRL